jgi:hypothetical protein
VAASWDFWMATAWRGFRASIWHSWIRCWRSAGSFLRRRMCVPMRSGCLCPGQALIIAGSVWGTSPRPRSAQRLKLLRTMRTSQGCSLSRPVDAKGILCASYNRGHDVGRVGRASWARSWLRVKAGMRLAAAGRLGHRCGRDRNGFSDRGDVRRQPEICGSWREKSTAAAVIVEPGFGSVAAPTLRIKNPYLAFAQAIEIFHPAPRYAPGSASDGGDC